jgi:hypothetical protein
MQTPYKKAGNIYSGSEGFLLYSASLSQPLSSYEKNKKGSITHPAKYALSS